MADESVLIRPGTVVVVVVVCAIFSYASYLLSQERNHSSVIFPQFLLFCVDTQELLLVPGHGVVKGAENGSAELESATEVVAPTVT